ncbi:hypothetical protein Leryth_005786 [Lithospermum erythrorhizon]|nr:hypothetical protein Leryth_005786 [Lithospermum erythrorhizon]
MDSSKEFEEGEECQSSESGWTMYIGSSTEDEESKDNDDDVAMNLEEVDDDDEVKKNDESDDSMASDASSGPSGILKGKDVSKLKKKEKNGSVKKINRGHEDSDQNVNKVRKNKQMGSRK